MANERTTTTSVDAIDREIHSVSTQGNQTVRVDVTYPYRDRESITITETTEGQGWGPLRGPIVDREEVVLQRRSAQLREEGITNYRSVDTSVSLWDPSGIGLIDDAQLIIHQIRGAHNGTLLITHPEGGTIMAESYFGQAAGDYRNNETVAAEEIRYGLEGILDRDEARGGTVRAKMIEEGYRMPPQMRDNLPANMRDFRDLPGGVGDDAPSHGLPATNRTPTGRGGHE